MTTRLLLLSLILTLPVRALVPGAWESFPTQTNADAWTVQIVYNDLSEDWFYPGWVDGADPYIDSALSEYVAYLFADASVAEGAFTGDYAAAGVESVFMDVYLFDPTVIDYLDVKILSDVGGVERYYYSGSFYGDEFDQPDEWYPLEVWFSDPWYWWDPTAGTDGDWVEVSLSAAELSNITEIGISFIHVEANTTDTIVGIDNVALNHAFITPELEVSAAAGVATFSFQTEPQHRYTIQNYDAANESWEDVTGQTDITGTGLYSYNTPALGTELYRCEAEPVYTEVVTPPSL